MPTWTTLTTLLIKEANTVVQWTDELRRAVEASKAKMVSRKTVKKQRHGSAGGEQPMTVLPDVLKPGLKVIFCGTAVGDTSAALGAYYAGPGNQFWGVLYRIGLTARQLVPQEFRSLLQYDIGLTDLAKSHSGIDRSIPSSAFDVATLRSKIERIAPIALAFNGKRAAEAFYGGPVDYGRQPVMVGRTTVFVLPSTSAAGRGYWDERYWTQLADFVGRWTGPHPTS